MIIRHFGTLRQIYDHNPVIKSQNRHCFDVYKDSSIKTAELEGRGEVTGTVHSITVAGQKIQQWRRPVRSSASKTALIKFIC